MRERVHEKQTIQAKHLTIKIVLFVKVYKYYWMSEGINNLCCSYKYTVQS